MKTHTSASLRRGILASALLGLTAISSHAAVVTWGAATNINPVGGAASGLDVSTTGTLVGAFNVGAPGVASTTVNGTTFTGLALTGTSVTSGNFTLSSTVLSGTNLAGSGAAPFSTLSSSYQALLSSTSNSTQPITLTMSGLVTGAAYQFEWWSTASSVNVNLITTATAGGVVALGSNTGAVLGGLGQFALGTFVADATTQQVITFASPTSNSLILDGFQLRLLPAAAAVPEPGSALAGMLALGVCLSGLGRRHRRESAAA